MSNAQQNVRPTDLTQVSNLLSSPTELFGEVSTEAPIIIAVSGGSDSLALLHLATAWAKNIGAHLHVATVDHGLRPEAAAEAAFVASICEGIGLPHVTLAWEGLKPTSRLAETSRYARYVLLEEFAREIGASTILVGHTLDDQVETVLMRNSRSTGRQTRGLSGISKKMRLPLGREVYRPLLSCKRDALRSYLTLVGQSWIEDPSNQDTAYERVRVRNTLSALDVSKDSIMRFADLIGRQREDLSKRVCAVLQPALKIAPGPVYRLELNAVRQWGADIGGLALQLLIALAGGGERFVPIEDVFERLNDDGEEPTSKRFTVGHCVVEIKGDALIVYRENRNLGAMTVGPGEKALWDQRLVIENNTEHRLACSALDRERLAALETDKRFSVRPRAALSSTPLVEMANGRVFLPFVRQEESFEGLTFDFAFPAIEHFCSCHDFAFLELTETIRRRFAQLLPHSK